MTPLLTSSQARATLAAATESGEDTTRPRAMLAAAAVAENMTRRLGGLQVPDDLTEALADRLAVATVPLDDPDGLRSLARRFRNMAERLELDALAAEADRADRVMA